MTPDSPIYREEVSSHLPAIRLLINMGWKVMTPREAYGQRGERVGSVLLEGVLTEWLRTRNEVTHKGKRYPFTEGNISTAVQALKSVLYDGLIRTNEKIYDMICLPKSLKQTIDGDTRSYDLYYVDWKHPERNVYHLVEELAVERSGRLDDREKDPEEEIISEGAEYISKRENVRRPDMILYVNGIPLVVIECKRPDLKNAVGEAVSQHLRNQKPNEIPALFQYAQILLSLAVNDAKYATVGTPLKYWAVWKEPRWTEEDESRVEALVNQEPDPVEWDKVLQHRTAQVQEHFEDYGEHRTTIQDRTLYGLCRPERLLELVYRYIVFDDGVKKIARYQQYFCVRRMLERVNHFEKESGARKGGIVWHTQGSGKSLTMVMMAKAIALDPRIKNPRIVLVTDRVDLDNQLCGTFRACGHEPFQAESGNHLAELLENEKTSIITTIIDKFETVSSKRNYQNTDPNVFVLVDESHRSQHGRVKNSRFGERSKAMRKVLRKACYLGFTGTPLMRGEKQTATLFGGLIDSYNIRQAVEDGAVVPLLYEGRDVELKVDKDAIDTWFERVTRNLSEEQRADLKKKFATSGQLQKADQLVRCVAWDVAVHFHDTWKGTGLKAQLVTPDKDTAIRYREYLLDTGLVSCEVLISGPDSRKDNESVEGETTNRVQIFWDQMVGSEGRYATEEQYNKNLVQAFKHSEDPEIIIVVSKLLTGFDAPRNTVLYLAKKLEGHSLLQAIARVNRLYEGKDFGYVLDYVGVLGKLDEALNVYGGLPEFDQIDLEGALSDISEYIQKLPQRHSDLWELFRPIRNRKDQEAFEQLLEDEALRAKFYERLSAYARVLQIALSSVEFSEETPPEKLRRYQQDLKFFESLRRSVRQRYAEQVDFKEYEKRIRALVDRHVGASQIQEIVPLVSIFDEEAFEKEVEKLPSARSKADTIASRTAKTIRERWEEDPAFYRKFSEMLQKIIDENRQGRLSDKDFLRSVAKVMKSVVHRTGDKIPNRLKHHDAAKAFYGLTQELLGATHSGNDQFDHFAEEVSLGAESIIKQIRIVNWTNNEDVINQMKLAVEDLVLDDLGGRFDIRIAFDDLDLLVEKIISVAKVRLA
ncbi:MAG: type I restriction endonuclease subunit R [Candidatus Sumerlaeia bacterium]|nr:type I restriction endonuclease subunit R [Candidatus Sumerlaeia bacterium]